ncbi:MAG: 5-methyltetrahydropteroyltriglutamate--homocysteine methyltransferase, partial [uncultured Acetobacteraceae bacterium]
RGGERRDPRPLRRRGRRGAGGRALHAGAAGRGAAIRAGGAGAGAGGHRGPDGGAHLLRLRRDHPRTAFRLLLPAGAVRLPGAAGLDRDGAIAAGHRRLGRLARQDRDPGRPRPLRHGGGNAGDGGGAHPPRAAACGGGQGGGRAGLRHEVPAARGRLRQDAGHGRWRRHCTPGAGGL